MAPAVADPLAAAARRLGPVLYMASTKIARRLPRHRARLLADVLYDFYDDRRHALGPDARSTTSTSPALMMALEQSIVMGIALA